MSAAAALPSIGQRFNRLVVVSLFRDQHWQAMCLCDCGTINRVRVSHVVAGLIKSCGCWRKHVSSTAHVTHGASRRIDRWPELYIWHAMIGRCYNPKHSHFENYGGRGITVCESWRDDFLRFVNDIGRRPSADLTLERRDNNGNYCPENCYWASRTIQANNRSVNHLVTIDEQTKTLAEWARDKGIPYACLRHRLDSGWSAEDALCATVRQHMSVEDARTVWKMRLSGLLQRDIAKSLNVTESNICAILTGYSWKNIYREFTGRESEKTNRRKH